MCFEAGFWLKHEKKETETSERDRDIRMHQVKQWLREIQKNNLSFVYGFGNMKVWKGKEQFPITFQRAYFTTRWNRYKRFNATADTWSLFSQFKKNKFCKSFTKLVFVYVYKKLHIQIQLQSRRVNQRRKKRFYRHFWFRIAAQIRNIKFQFLCNLRCSAYI